MNTTKTIVLMIGLTVLLIFVGGALGGRQGLIFAFVFAMAMNMFSYWFSDKIVLRMYNAREVTEAEAPMLWGVTHDLSLKMNMPMPKVYAIPSDASNAFATGRNHETILLPARVVSVRAAGASPGCRAVLANAQAALHRAGEHERPHHGGGRL